MTEEPAPRVSQAPQGAQSPAPEPVSRPSRADTTEAATAPPCLFCDRSAHKVIAESVSWYIRLDAYPAAPGHVEVVPTRHVESYFDLTEHEGEQLHSMLALARRMVTARWGEPDGWTIGVNDGRAAGRSIDHLHVHLIPRHHGDVPDPRGGIRRALPNGDPDAWAASLDRPGDPQHTGGNAEDCPVCRPLIDQPGGVLYPWHCTAADTDHREETPDV